MDFPTRISKAIKVLRGQEHRIDFDAVSKQLDSAIARGELPTGDEIIVEKSSKSKLDIRDTDRDLVYVSLYNILRDFVGKIEKIPAYGDPSRDEYLDKLWHNEPILAGAIYSMSAKMTALKWHVTGKRRRATAAARLLSQAAFIDGYGWDGFISSTAQDFYTTNRGVFWETPRIGSAISGKLADLGHIDALCCQLTGNRKTPMVYASALTGQTLRFREGEFIHFSSLPSSRETMVGQGFCAVDRAYRAAKLLLGLHDYDEEKLSSLPPEGVAAVTGLTMDEFNDAVALWKAARKQNNNLTFPQVLWLIGSQPNAQVSVDIQGFSSLPESFDRQTVVTAYISTLALDFGVDAREFWPISSGSLGTASESEIQHIKAKGKGPGEFISITERHINGEFPEDADFAYDTQDIEEDANAAAVAKAWVDAFLPISELGGVQNGIKADDFMRLLADKDVIPDYLVNDERIVIDDTEVRHDNSKEFRSHGNPEDVTCIVWEKGILKEKRLPPIIVNSRMQEIPLVPDIYDDFVEAEYVEVKEQALLTSGNGSSGISLSTVEQALEVLKQAAEELYSLERKITGGPIPEREVVRGSNVTKNTIRDELERWRKDPILSKYAPTSEEEDALINAITNKS